LTYNESRLPSYTIRLYDIAPVPLTSLPGERFPGNCPEEISGEKMSAGMPGGGMSGYRPGVA